MNWLPRNSILGELELAETFVFFDGPRVFSCRSRTDQMYVAGWAEEGIDADTWLYLAISQNRLALVRSGGMLLRDAFLNPEGKVYVARLPDDIEERDLVEEVDPSEIPEGWLPANNFRLNLSTHTAPLADDADTIARKALEENRTRLRIKLDHPDYYRTEAPTRQIGEILVLTQRVLDNFGLSLDSETVAKTGPIPFEVASRTASDLVGLSAASFVIELAASSFDDLLGGSLFADATMAIVVLLDPELESGGISVELSEIGPRAAKSFRKFVKGLADSGADVAFSAAGTSFEYVSHRLPSERLELLMQILNRLVPDDDVREIRGRMELIAFDSDRRTFGVETRDGIKYEGKVDDRAYAQSSHATIHDNYDVLIFAVSVLDEAIGETNVTYTLSQLIPVEEDEPRAANQLPVDRGGAGVDDPT